jgi:hypothetical protein
MSIQNLMEHAYEKTNHVSDMSISTPAGFRNVLVNNGIYTTYRDALSEGLSDQAAINFKLLADNTRLALLESNNMGQFNPYETFSIPVLRKFFPRLIANQLVNVMPMDKPNIVKYFIKGKFKTHGQSSFPDDQTFPVMSGDMSRGKSHGIATTASSARSSNPGATVNILTEMSLTESQAHIEKDFTIIGVTDSTGTVAVNIMADVDGNFSSAVTTKGGNADTISGTINFETGVFSWSSTTGEVTGITYSAYASLEENQINTKTKFDLEKIRINSILRTITAEWTIPFEQDVRALFDINIQSQLVNMMGEQMALDIDKEIITALLNENTTKNPASHSASFDLNPAATYDGNQVEWFRDILYPMNKLAAKVYDDTQMGQANVVACNPVSAAVLESINTFRYDGSAANGGELGYTSGTLQGGKYKVLVSSVVPENKLLIKYRSDDAQRASYIYCPYVPTMITPYPLGNTPGISVMTRYGKKSLRPEALAVLTITNTA